MTDQQPTVVEPRIAPKIDVWWSKFWNALNGKKAVIGFLVLWAPDILELVGHALRAADVQPLLAAKITGWLILAAGVTHKVLKFARRVGWLAPDVVLERRQESRRAEDPPAVAEPIPPAGRDQGDA